MSEKTAAALLEDLTAAIKRRAQTAAEENSYYRPRPYIPSHCLFNSQRWQLFFTRYNTATKSEKLPPRKMHFPDFPGNPCFHPPPPGRLFQDEPDVLERVKLRAARWGWKISTAFPMSAEKFRFCFSSEVRTRPGAPLRTAQTLPEKLRDEENVYNEINFPLIYFCIAQYDFGCAIRNDKLRENCECLFGLSIKNIARLHHYIFYFRNHYENM